MQYLLVLMLFLLPRSVSTPRSSTQPKLQALTRPRVSLARAFWLLFVVCAIPVVCSDEMPHEFSTEDDLLNQELLVPYFSKSYYSDRFAGTLPAQQRAELRNLILLAQQHPVLALGAAHCAYMYGWYSSDDGEEQVRDSAKIDWASVEEAAELFELSILQGGCLDPDMPLERFLDELSCDTRWTHAIFLREHLSHWYQGGGHDLEKAAFHSSRAQALLQGLVQTPRFSGECCVSWTKPTDVNSNALFFPHAFSAPVWPRERALSLDIARFFEESQSVFRAELLPLLEGISRDDWASANPGAVSAEHLASTDGWFMLSVVRHGEWNLPLCELAPRSCEMVASRPEISRCSVSNVNLMRLAPGAQLKPHFGNAPRLSAHLSLSVPEPEAAHLRVGAEVATWKEGEVLIFDDTFVHSVSHSGVLPRVVLSAWFCHPCDTNPDHQHGQTCVLRS